MPKDYPNNLLMAIDGAKFVYHDDLMNLIYVWHGGVTVNIYTYDGVALDCFTQHDLTPDNISNVIHEHIAFNLSANF